MTPPGHNTYIVFLATAWGTKYGGINSFNADLVLSLAGLLRNTHTILCVVPKSEDVEDRHASEHDIHLISLDDASESLVADHAYKIRDLLMSRFSDLNVAWWIGHDVKTGPAAVALAEMTGQGRSALIHHMSYEDYQSYKTEARKAEEKYQLQQDIFRRADHRFAVGPLLRDRLSDLVNDDNVTMLIPGIVEDLSAKPQKAFSAITFGRLDPENDKIKQGTLAVDAFASAIKSAREDAAFPQCFRKNPRMRLYGVKNDEQERSLKLRASEKAGGAINLKALPYTTDRDTLLERMSTSSVALMLSWHEGFGLTGWEAISAEVPLILTEQSGLYEFIGEVLGGSGTGCLWPVRVEGLECPADDPGAEIAGPIVDTNYTPDTLERVRSILLQCGLHIVEARRDAATLKRLLLHLGYTWDNTALTFADALGLSYGNIHNNSGAGRSFRPGRAYTSLSERFDEDERARRDLQELRADDRKLPDLIQEAERAQTVNAAADDDSKAEELIRVVQERDRLIGELKAELAKERASSRAIPRKLWTYQDSSQSLDVVSKVVCYNQGEYTQYSFLAARFHKLLKNAILEGAAPEAIKDRIDALTDFLSRNFFRIASSNFSFMRDYFGERHTVTPRCCIKANSRKEGQDYIVELIREKRVPYYSEYPLSSNAGFAYVRETGKYFLCNDIPSGSADGSYVNARIDTERARTYQKERRLRLSALEDEDEQRQIAAEDFKWDEDWIKCWKVESGLPKAIDLRSYYKSTLIVPITLWNNSLDPSFRDEIRAEDVGRAIFGYLCADHVESNYFTGDDVKVSYIFADLLSLYLINRSMYTEWSDTFRAAMRSNAVSRG